MTEHNKKINFKLIGFKLGEELKDKTTLKRIDGIATAIFDFPVSYHPHQTITSARSQKIYDWVMTLGEQPIDEKEKIRLLQEFINELTEENDPLRNLLKVKEELHETNENNFKIKKDSTLSKSIEKGLLKFLKEHRPEKTVFIMMKFSGGDPDRDKKLENLYTSIKLELDKYGLEAVRADEKDYSDTGYLWDNIQIYLNGCGYGIAVLENLYYNEMNPNVALEYGYMMAKGKKVLLLKEKTFQNINADILGKIWKEFDIDDPNTVKKAIQSWMVDLGIPQIKAL